MNNDTLRQTLMQQRQDAIARQDWPEYQRLNRALAMLPMKGLPQMTLAQLHTVYSAK